MTSFIRKFASEERAAAATEFALVVPIMILFMLGIIDTGRFIWNTNELEKAVQIGTRWAVATDMVTGYGQDDGLMNYSFAAAGVPQGTVVNSTSFPGVYCESGGGGVSCTCKGSCDFEVDPADASPFNSVVGRMNEIYAGISAENVRIDYDWSGLGYSGDPNGSDVDPLVTVTVKDIGFRPIFLGGIFNFGLPDLSYTLTMEDGVGGFSN